MHRRWTPANRGVDSSRLLSSCELKREHAGLVKANQKSLLPLCLANIRTYGIIELMAPCHGCKMNSIFPFHYSFGLNRSRMRNTPW